MLTAKEFKRYSLQKKFKLVRREGEFLGSRIFESYNVHLFRIEDFFVEVWQRLGLQQVYWVEVVTYDQILINYSDQIDLNKLLGDAGIRS